MACRRMATLDDEKLTKMVGQKMLKEIGAFLDEDDRWSSVQKGMQCLVRFKIEMRESKLDVKNKLLVQQVAE